MNALEDYILAKTNLEEDTTSDYDELRGRERETYNLLRDMLIYEDEGDENEEEYGENELQEEEQEEDNIPKYPANSLGAG